MEKIIGIRFKAAGKIYDFNCGAYVLNTGDRVIVETENGLCFGTVAVPPMAKERKAEKAPLKKSTGRQQKKTSARLKKTRISRPGRIRSARSVSRNLAWK